MINKNKDYEEFFNYIDKRQGIEKTQSQKDYDEFCNYLENRDSDI